MVVLFVLVLIFTVACLIGYLRESLSKENQS